MQAGKRRNTRTAERDVYKRQCPMSHQSINSLPPPTHKHRLQWFCQKFFLNGNFFMFIFYVLSYLLLEFLYNKVNYTWWWCMSSGVSLSLAILQDGITSSCNYPILKCHPPPQISRHSHNLFSIFLSFK